MDTEITSGDTPTPENASGYQAPVNQTTGYGNGEAITGAGNTPWQTDHFSDGYQENVFEQNFGDTPYTESAINPNPQLRGYSRGSGYQPRANQADSAPHLEL